MWKQVREIGKKGLIVSSKWEKVGDLQKSKRLTGDLILTFQFHIAWIGRKNT